MQAHDSQDASSLDDALKLWYVLPGLIFHVEPGSQPTTALIRDRLNLYHTHSAYATTKPLWTHSLQRVQATAQLLICLRELMRSKQ